MTKQTNITAQPAIQKTASRASISGAILSVSALAVAAIGYGLAHAHYNGVKASTRAEKVDSAIANGTVHALGSIFSLPFLIGGLFFGVVAILLIVIRLRKVKGSGLFMSIVWILVSVWAIDIVMKAFNLLKAHS